MVGIYSANIFDDSQLLFLQSVVDCYASSVYFAASVS